MLLRIMLQLFWIELTLPLIFLEIVKILPLKLPNFFARVVTIDCVHFYFFCNISRSIQHISHVIESIYDFNKK